MNPCPCGYLGHPKRECTCSQNTIDRYLQKISGPLLDRIDLHIEVSPVEYKDLSSDSLAEKSADILKRVMAAREIQHKRFEKLDIVCNSQIPSNMLKDFCKCDDAASLILKNSFEKLSLSARSYDRILKVSRTIADLGNSDIICAHHIAEALQYRNLDKKYWK